MSEWKGSDIGDIPIEAKLIELGECLELIIDHRGKTPRKLGSDWVESGIPAISAKNIHSGSLTNHEDIRFVTKEIYERWMGDHDVETGDCLLVSEGATLGETLIWKYPLPIVLSQRVFCLRVDKSILDPYYFYYYVTTDLFQNQIIGAASGSTVMGLRQSVLLKLLVPVVDLGCQKLIGELLSSLDDKIDLLHRQNQTLEQMAETLFRQWFVEEADDDWEEITFGDLVVPQKGKNITKKDAIDGPYPVVAGGLEPSCYHNVCNTKEPVVTISASGANAGYVRLYTTKIWSSDSSFIDYSVTPFVYFSYIFLKINQTILFDKQTGSAQPHIYPAQIMELDCLNYPDNLIDEFENWCKPIFEKIKSNQTQIRTLTALRDTLLPKLMSGEVRVEMDATAKMEEA